MHLRDPDNPHGLSAAALAEVDRVCAMFESAWQQEQRPNVGDYLGKAPAESRSALLAELMLLDLDYRRLRGECPTPEDYVELAAHELAALETVFSQDGTAVQASLGAVEHGAPSPPTTLGRYRVIEQIGSGSFGTVYRAHDDELDRDVAIKVPHAHLMHRDAAIKLFRREARALATLRHPAIVPVYDVHFDEHAAAGCYVVSQLTEGGDLASRVSRERPDTTETAQIVERLADALHYAHTHGVVHRDVKLANILLDTQGQPQLADFGLALHESESGDSAPGGFVGTPASMSPEQARGEADDVDGRTDIYALGVVLYQLLTGHRPFPEKEMSVLLKSIQTRSPKPPRQYDDTIPRELERICLKALAKQPTDRYATASDMAADLRRYLRSREPRFWTRTRALFAAAAALTAVVGWWRLATFDSSATQSSPLASASITTLAILPFTAIHKEDSGRDLEILGMGMADTLATKLKNVRQLILRSPESIDDQVASDLDPVATGKKLQADAVLLGSLQEAEDRTLAKLRLIRVDDGKLIWTETIEEASADFFSLQDAISAQVIRSLALQLSPQEERRIRLRHTDNRQAYEAYVRGRHAWQQRDRMHKDDLGQAINHFRAAIDADPLFALAYVGLAESYAMTNLYIGRDMQALPRARAAAKKALELDPELTDAHAVLALVKHYYDWDFEAAEAGFERAIELNPNNATARQWYAELLYFSRRFDESIVQLRKAAELDPLSPVIASLQGAPYMWRGDYQRARQELESALRLHPNSTNILYGLGTVAMQQGRLEEAIEYHRQHVSDYQVAYVLTKMGDLDEARRILRRLEENHTPYPEAVVNIGLGNSDVAFTLLNEAVDNRDERLVWALVDPKLDPIREDPRFLKLLKRLGRVK